MPKETRLVYSTESGRIDSDSTQAIINPDDAVISVRRETKGRGGKEATVVWNVPGGPDDLKTLAKALKRRLGTGGSAKQGEIVIQGDHVVPILEFLAEQGYRVKKAGG
jgi:Translation initiation factor 1 (eIF-1/SUI1) and related proteins